jgi:hypothetical protein
MHNDFWDKAKENIMEQDSSESEACPIMSVFQYLQAITIELSIPFKIQIMKGLHRNLVFSMIFSFVGLLLECDVVFNWATRIFCLFVLSGREGRRKGPQCEEDRDRSEECEEYGRLQSAADFP